MNARRVLQASRVLLTLLAIGVWLMASNHCLVAGLLPAQGEHEHCPGHKTTEQPKQDGGCDGQNCCKSLSALATASVKNLGETDRTAFRLEDYPRVEAALFGGEQGTPLCELDTGPPPGVSLAEIVLQQSLLAHAPPFCG